MTPTEQMFEAQAIATYQAVLKRCRTYDGVILNVQPANVTNPIVDAMKAAFLAGEAQGQKEQEALKAAMQRVIEAARRIAPNVSAEQMRTAPSHLRGVASGYVELVEALEALDKALNRATPEPP